MITVYKYVVYSKNNRFLKCILSAHRNDYCIQMLLSGKTEVASPEELSGHNQSRFRILQYDRRNLFKCHEEVLYLQPFDPTYTF